MSEPLLEVGRIGKAHGLKGEVVVSLTTTMVAERTAIGSQLFDGERWLTVSAVRPHQEKWLYRFEGVGDRNGADLLRGRTLSAEPIDSEDEVFVHELIGLTLIDQAGAAHGKVISVIENPASDLMELPGEKLVPLSFYVSHDADAVRVDVPAGLLDDEAAELAAE